MMKKILIGAAILAVLVVLLVVVGVFLALGQVNSASTRERIRLAASEALGAEVQLAGHRVGLTGTVELQGIAVANAAPHEKSPLASLQRVDVTVSPLSLFSGKPVVRRLTLSGLDVNLHRTAEGGLSLPFKPKPADEAAPADGSAAPAAEPAGLPIEPVVEQIDVSKVNVTVHEADQSVLAAVRDLGAQGTARMEGGAVSAELQTRIVEVQVHPGLKFRNVAAPVNFDGRAVQLPNISAEFAGGKAAAQAGAEVKAPGRPFTAQAKIEGARMEQVLADLGTNPDTLKGGLKGDFTGGGSLDAVKDLAGKGTFEITPAEVGKLRNPVLPAGLLGVPALQTGQFDTITGVYKIEGQKVVVEDLKILSKGLRISITGTIGFDKVLDLQGRMIVDASPVSKIADVAQNFMQGLLGGKKDDAAAQQPTPASQTLAGGVPFTVQGTTDAPKVRPVGPDPLNLVTLLAKALGFQTEEPAPTAPPAEGAPAGAPAEAAPAPTAPVAEPEKPPGGLRGLLPF